MQTMYVQCELPREAHLYLKNLAYRRGITLRQLVRKILTDYFEQEKEKEDGKGK